MRVRVRGIYATALTKILLDEGFQIVQASALISHRLGIPQIPAAADVTVKSIEDEPSRILVIGYPEHVDAVVSVLRKHLPYSPFWCSPLGLYATIVARVKQVEEGRCIVEVNGVEFEAFGVGECKPGEHLVLYVVKAPVFPGERGRAAPGVRVVGDYAMLYKGGEARVTMSEHISRADRRALLASIAVDYTSRGYGVHWRSSARDAEESVLREELSKLEEALRRAEEEAQKLVSEKRTGIVTPGERICIAELSSVDKEKLDDVRASVLPTAKLHHTVKSLAGGELQAIIDYIEEVLAEASSLRELLARGLVRYIASKLEGRRLTIEHVKLDGRVVEIGPALVKEVRVDGDKIMVRLERVVRTPGVYDGLNVEKEPGDRIETIVETGSWTITHRYYSKEGDLKGVYINVNTPPEITPERIRYIDLTVDVVRKPDGTAQVIDVEEFSRFVKLGVVGEKLVEKVREVVREAAGVEVQI